MTSVGARRRAKKARRATITLPGAEVAPARPTGRDRWHTNQSDGPPPILAARAVHGPAGADPLSMLHVDDVGRCILALAGGDERRALAETWTAILTAHRHWRSRIINRTAEPQGAASMMIPEPVETPQGHTIDSRTPEERDIGAIRAWSAWRSHIARLPTPQHRWAIMGALDGYMGDETLWRDRKPTPLGALCINALCHLAHLAAKA